MLTDYLILFKEKLNPFFIVQVSKLSTALENKIQKNPIFEEKKFMI